MEDYLVKALTYVLIAILNVIGYYLVNWLKKHKVITELKANEEIVKIVVKAVQESFYKLDGVERYEIAKDKLIEIFNEKGIKVSETQLDTLINQSVLELRSQFEYAWKNAEVEKKEDKTPFDVIAESK